MAVQLEQQPHGGKPSNVMMDGGESCFVPWGVCELHIPCQNSFYVKVGHVKNMEQKRGIGFDRQHVESCFEKVP